jgi:hypothetical protein
VSVDGVWWRVEEGRSFIRVRRVGAAGNYTTQEFCELGRGQARGGALDPPLRQRIYLFCRRRVTRQEKRRQKVERHQLLCALKPEVLPC